MKKLVLLMLSAVTPVMWLSAQPGTPNLFTPSSEIIWQLDSLIPCHVPELVDASKYQRDSLNIHGYAEDYVPVYPSEIIAQRLKDIGSPIEMTYNNDVQVFIDLYTQHRRRQVERMLGLTHVYFPIFEAELDKQGVPMELKYLPIVESALNPHARSRVGATGLWQFMLGTGKLYDLQVTSYVDERRDPFKSTEAAVRYLKNMYATYHDWLLVVAAYNCGPGNVNKAIAKSGGKRSFWEIQEFLPRETRSYVPALIAATYVFNYATEHNLFPKMVDFTFAQDTVHITRQLISLKQLAEMTNTDFWILKDLNPELKSDIVPYTADPYVLRVPMKTGQLFATFRDSIMAMASRMVIDSVKVVYSDQRISPLTNKPYENENPGNTTYASKNVVTEGKRVVYHKVRRGEAVSSIAAKYHVSTRDLAKWNGLRNYAIRAGQSLKIYVKSSSAPTASVKETVPSAAVANSGSETGEQASSTEETGSPANKEESITAKKSMADVGTRYHVVKQGDTLWQIASTYDGLTVEKLKSLNALNSNSIMIGQKLRIQ